MSEEISYSVRRSTRARRVRVHVTVEAAVEVVLPQRAPQRAAAAAVSELRPWIERRLVEARSTLARMPVRDGTLPYLDARLRIIPEAGRQRVHRHGTQLLVPARDAQQPIERFYRRSARREVATRLDRATASAGTEYRDLTIRAQRTRWASCSSNARMSFNWRLMLAPERVLDYVIWHEVCHLEIQDHSRRFWSLLESRWPSWRTERDWLRKFGPTLVLP
jgi:predicted metal-dependent hydrolase